MSKILLPMFSSRIFMVLSVTFNLLIHFEFILVYSVKADLVSFFLAVQFSQYHYRTDFLYLIVCPCLLFQILIEGVLYFNVNCWVPTTQIHITAGSNSGLKMISLPSLPFENETPILPKSPKKKHFHPEELEPEDTN